MYVHDTFRLHFKIEELIQTIIKLINKSMYLKMMKEDVVELRDVSTQVGLSSIPVPYWFKHSLSTDHLERYVTKNYCKNLFNLFNPNIHRYAYAWYHEDSNSLVELINS